MPTVGNAIFAQQVPSDASNRLFYSPLGTNVDGNPKFITLAQYVAVEDKTSTIYNEIRRVLENPGGHKVRSQIQKIYSEVDTMLEPEEAAHFRGEFEQIKRNGKEGLERLLLGNLKYIGIMVRDNLTEIDREWWAIRGKLQITTCVEGLATVRFDPEKAGKLAMDYFTPLSPAYWDIVKNVLVKVSDDEDPRENPQRYKKIGTIISTGVREINILTNAALL